LGLLTVVLCIFFMMGGQGVFAENDTSQNGTRIEIPQEVYNSSVKPLREQLEAKIKKLETDRKARSDRIILWSLVAVFGGLSYMAWRTDGKKAIFKIVALWTVFAVLFTGPLDFFRDKLRPSQQKTDSGALRTDSRDLRFLMQVGQGLGNKNDIYLIYTGDEKIYDVDLELSTTFQNFTGTTQRHLDAMAPLDKSIVEFPRSHGDFIKCLMKGSALYQGKRVNFSDEWSKPR